MDRKENTNGNWGLQTCNALLVYNVDSKEDICRNWCKEDICRNWCLIEAPVFNLDNSRTGFL